MLSEIEREAIYREPKKIDAESIKWEQRGTPDRFYLKVPVHRSNGEELQLRGVLCSRKYSFSLLYRGTILIRRWDYEYHNNPVTGETFNWTPHKHKWTELYGEESAYAVNDIPTDDVEKALEAFLIECNISITGTFQPSIFSLS